MLLELKQSQLLINGKPFAEDLRLAIFNDRNAFRMKFNYCGEGESSEPIDLMVWYELPKFHANPLPKASITFNGNVLDPQDEKKILKQFKFTLTLNLLKGGLRVTGNIGAKLIDRTITSPVEILEIIKSAL